MSNFAEQINEAYEDTRAVDDLADNTQATVRNGKDIVNELMKQVTSTAGLHRISLPTLSSAGAVKEYWYGC